MYNSRNYYTDKLDPKLKEMSDKFAKDNNMEKPKETIKWWEPIESKEG